MGLKNSSITDKDYINVTAAIIRKGEEVLITKRAQNQPFPGKWEFPGGKIDLDETLENCLTRELLEELGIKIRVEEPFLVYEYDYNRPDGKRHRIFSFWCRILEGEPSLRVHDSATWVRMKDLLGFDFIEADKQLVDLLLKN